jgi:hypothetical protein
MAGQDKNWMWGCNLIGIEGAEKPEKQVAVTEFSRFEELGQQEFLRRRQTNIRTSFLIEASA